MVYAILFLSTPPETEWEKGYSDWLLTGYYVVQTKDKGYLIGGMCSQHSVFLKVDSIGNVMWYVV